jgi:D-xylose transport system permease protein
MRSRIPVQFLTMSLILALLCVFFAVAAPQFLSPRNLSLLATELAITASLALGMLLVILPGHIDLAAGSGVGLLGGIASVLVFEHRFPAPLALLIALGTGLLLWRGMGALIIREKIPAFIITLGGLLVFKGLFWLVIHNATIPVVAGGSTNLYSLLTTFSLPPAAGIATVLLIAGLTLFLHFRNTRSSRSQPETEERFLKLFIGCQSLLLFVLVANQYRGIPFPAILCGCIALVLWVLTQHTPFGRYLYAIGGNEEAALVSGIPVRAVVTTAYTLMGAIVALTGFMQTAYAGASTTTVGELMELDAVAACVIGGVSLKGGRGSVPGVLFGAALMAVLLNGMTLLAFPPELKFIARGTVLALAVWLDVRTSRNAH